MRNSSPHFVLADSVDFSLLVLGLLIGKRWHLEDTRQTTNPTMPPQAKTHLMAQGQSEHRSLEETSGCATYDSGGWLLSGGTCEPASNAEETGGVKEWVPPGDVKRDQ